MTKADLKQLIKEVVKEVSTTPRSTTPKFVGKEELAKLAEAMKKTMAYHNKFISENPPLIKESKIVMDKEFVERMNKFNEVMEYHRKFIAENPLYKPTE